MTPLLDLGEHAHLLAVGAHADDIELGCGGTVLKLVERLPGLRVTWVVLTAGRDGTRRAEAQASADTFLAGAARVDVRLHDLRDRYLPYEPATAKAVFEELAADLSGPDAPDLVLTHRRDDRHQDHRFVAELCWQTFRDSMLLEYEIPKWERDLGQPTLYVHLDDDHVDRKVAAVREHFASQHDKAWFDEEAFRALLRLRGIEAKAPSGYAEGFQADKLVLT